MDNTPSSVYRLVLKYARHLFTSGNRRGHGIHSPSIYAFVRKVLLNEDRMKAPSEVIEYHKKLLRDKTLLSIVDFGAGSRVTRAEKRPVSSIAARSSVTRKQGEFLYRFCSWYQPSRVVEFGTGLGISTAYITAGAENANIVTVEGSPEKHNFASKHVPVGSAGSVEYLLGHFDDHFEGVLKSLENNSMVFLDGDHTYESTIRRVKRMMVASHIEELIIVLDDIYWSAGMEAAWKELIMSQEGLVTIDMFHFGIIKMKKGTSSQHFVLKF